MDQIVHGAYLNGDREGKHWVVQGCRVTLLNQLLIDLSSQVPPLLSSPRNPKASSGEVQQPHPSFLSVAPVNVFIWG